MSFLSNDAKRYDYVFALRLYKLFYMLTWFFMPSYEGWLSNPFVQKQLFQKKMLFLYSVFITNT